METYTVVVNEVPVKELLFALARDAEMNVDIHPAVDGNVTLNAVDQSLVQILDRITRQVDLRYELRRDSIFVGPDQPFLRTYKVDYVNMARNTTNTVKVSTGVIASGIGSDGGSGGSGDSGGGGGSSGGANSETSVDSVSNNQFWDTLTDTITRMIAGDERNQDADSGFVAQQAVIPNREAGILVVRATSRQHEDVQRYLDQVLISSKRQVLIEATIVEVELSDAYQAGIDWSEIAASAGFIIAQSVVTGGFAGLSSFLFLPDARGPTAELAYSSSPGDNKGIDLTVRLLKAFGDTRVLSSPKIMALNNQTAVLQVVQNFVYFEVDSTVSQNDNNAVTATSTTARTVPVGVILAVTPQIDGADQVTLNVRPTISRVVATVPDPNPDIPPNLSNEVPVIAVREMESVLRVGSGQIAVLGGLMQDQYNTDTDDVPVLSEAPLVGEAFRFRSQESVKSELVIFMRPWVIRSPDVRTDLAAFEPFLPQNQAAAQPALSPIGEALQNPAPPAGAAN